LSQNNVTEVQVWDGLNVDFSIKIYPHDNGSHKYSYRYVDEENRIRGEGNIYSIHPTPITKLLTQIIEGVREKLG
jgi:hypothetical protein